MMRKFVYLDHESLNQYLAAIENGITKESIKRSLTGGGKQGGVDAKVANLSGGTSHEEEESRTFSDTDGSRFERLLKAAAADSDELGWVEVSQPDVDFSDIGIGAMVSWECDLYVPDVVQALSGSGEALEAMSKVRSMLPAAKAFGLDTEGLPSESEMEAASNLITGMNAKLLVVGEDEETVWQVAGQINDTFLHANLEGRARIVGKVAKVLPQGRWKPYLTFPGMNLVSREKRREMERQAPPAGKENEYLPGPALMLDILAIYR